MCFPPCLHVFPRAADNSCYSVTQYHAIYFDEELHLLFIEVLIRLLTTPKGLLDPLYEPQDNTGGWMGIVMYGYAM